MDGFGADHDEHWEMDFSRIGIGSGMKGRIPEGQGRTRRWMWKQVELGVEMEEN
jgi:hypothetical protein